MHSLWKANRNVYTLYRMVTLSMIFNDHPKSPLFFTFLFSFIFLERQILCTDSPYRVSALGRHTFPNQIGQGRYPFFKNFWASSNLVKLDTSNLVADWPVLMYACLCWPGASKTHSYWNRQLWKNNLCMNRLLTKHYITEQYRTSTVAYWLNAYRSTCETWSILGKYQVHRRSVSQPPSTQACRVEIGERPGALTPNPRHTVFTFSKFSKLAFVLLYYHI